jgi:CBS domain-containing membrane protein
MTLKLNLFAPILAGVTLRERLLACLGVLIGVTLTGLITALVCGKGAALPYIVAPIGASSVLLFVIPASPLAQPWPIIGGNTISALVGIAVGHLIHEPVLAGGIAVALAILVMTFTRSLHPPGGALALTGALGSAGFLFPFVPVALNCLVLVALGILFHRLCRRSYPHVAQVQKVNTHHTKDLPAPLRAGFNAQDIDAALAALGESFDIDRGDIDRLLRQVEQAALARAHGPVLCRDVMSRDVIQIGPQDSPAAARALLLAHNITSLPVVGADGVLLGTVGLRELVAEAAQVGALAREAATSSPEAPAVSLVPVLTQGRTRAVVIVDAARQVLGLITPTDLLAVLARV